MAFIYLTEKGRKTFSSIFQIQLMAMMVGVSVLAEAEAQQGTGSFLRLNARTE